jgi:dihydrofolate synthase/folylpolyglutamate synthase
VKSSPPDPNRAANARPQTLGEWLQLLEYRHHTAIDLGLDRAQAVWRRMGSPKPADRIFVVAGTNGKGSTVATICGLLGGLGYRFGCYTTPHIHAYNERVQVGGNIASDAQLIDAFERVEAALDGVSLSYFEFGTLAAFQLLSEQELDFAVMEIGLGGRLDAVNLLDADCSVITPVGLDHQEYLGDNREAIGREKAGIIRPGIPLVCGDPDPPASILQIAAENGADVRLLGRDYAAWPCGDHACFRVGEEIFHLPLPSLRGAHQFDNAATGLCAVLQLLPEAVERPDALARGLASVELRGRFDRVAQSPDVWIDVGHNPMGAMVIADTLRDRGAPERRIRCVLAMLVDKDAESVAGILDEVVSDWLCAGLRGDRGQDAGALYARIAPVVGASRVRAFQRVSDALQAALDESAPEDGILVFGSFHTADEADRFMAGR